MTTLHYPDGRTATAVLEPMAGDYVRIGTELFRVSHIEYWIYKELERASHRTFLVCVSPDADPASGIGAKGG